MWNNGPMCGKLEPCQPDYQEELDRLVKVYNAKLALIGAIEDMIEICGMPYEQTEAMVLKSMYGEMCLSVKSHKKEISELKEKISP